MPQAVHFSRDHAAFSSALSCSFSTKPGDISMLKIVPERPLFVKRPIVRIAPVRIGVSPSGCGLAETLEDIQD
jgi:hypothetical protein